MDPVTDSSQVVKLHRRHKFGLVMGEGFALTPEAYRAMLEENGAVRFFVAQDSSQIIGAVGLATIDRNRAMRPGEAAACHFIVEASARGSLAGGKLFDAVVDHVAEAGYRTVRLRAYLHSPSLRLYLRSGFRAVGEARVDQYLALELVNHLPGVVAASRRAVQHARALGHDWEDGHWSLIKGMRGTLDDGVERLPDGSSLLTYSLGFRGTRIDATVVGDTGRVVRFLHNGEDHTEDYLVWAEGLADGLAERTAPTPGEARRVGRFNVHVDSSGTLLVDHPDHLGPVLRDVFPVATGTVVPSARPPLRDITVTATPDGWTARDGDGVERRVTVHQSELSVECRRPAGLPGPLAAWPNAHLRTAELAARRDGAEPADAPFRPGHWPIALPSYEAAAGPWCVEAAGTTLTWADRGAGLEIGVDWLDAGQLRPWGEARAAGEVLRYRIRPAEQTPITLAPVAGCGDVVSADTGEQTSITPPSGTGPLDTPAAGSAGVGAGTGTRTTITTSPVAGSADAASASTEEKTPTPLASWAGQSDTPAAGSAGVKPAGPWERTTRGRVTMARLTAPGGELVVDEASGLVRWTSGGAVVLRAEAGGLGEQVRAPSALWASIDSDRTEPSRGAELAESDPRVRFAGPVGLGGPGRPGGGATWGPRSDTALTEVDATRGLRADTAPTDVEATWSLRADADLTEVEATLSVPGTFAGREAALNLAPSARLNWLEMADSAGTLSRAACRDDADRPIGSVGLWWGFTRRVRLPLPDGRWLDIVPAGGEHQEILVRALDGGFVLTLLTRVTEGGTEARWRFRVQSR
ncbi:MAG: GNAT family N-acetyltransferase [Propionibacteriaceae bacterium]|nr:GNAT family N-acetyltransferase [Propionibacteriaceae bacterium]